VYDGHGGHEVATYTAQHLPQYLKNCEAYKRGDYTQALKDAFLEFDATLTTPDVLVVLKQIASNKDCGHNSESGNTHLPNRNVVKALCLYLVTAV
jgi:protein phosphatase 1G